jgi:hypothetical protein
VKILTCETNEDVSEIIANSFHFISLSEILEKIRENLREVLDEFINEIPSLIGQEEGDDFVKEVQEYFHSEI